MLRITIRCVLLVLLAILISTLTPLTRAAMVVVPFGWAQFIARTLPNVSVNWSGIGMIALCSAVIVFTLQRFLTWIYVTIMPRDPVPQRPPAWPWRWTFALYGLFWLLFGIVIGASGAMRQTTWLIQFTEPLYKPRLNGYSEMRIASAEVQMALLDSGGDIQQAQKLLLSFRRNGSGAWDYHQFLFITNRTSQIDVAIIPREPEAQQKVGFLLLSDNDEKRLPISELPTVLSRYASAR